MVRIGSGGRVARRLATMMMVVVCAAAASVVHAQEPDTDTAEESREPGLKFSIIGGPFYNEKVKLAAGAAPLLTFSLDRDDPELQRSTVTFPFSFSTNGSLAVAAASRMFFPGDQMRGIGAVLLKRGPDQYFGRGYENGADEADADSYDGEQVRLAWTQQWQVADDLFVGPGVDVKYRNATEFPDDGLIANEQNQPETFNTGIVALGSYDSRDIVGNAYEGMLFEVDARLFRQFLGGDNDYARLRLDYRGYQKISATRNYAIAWQFLTERAWGDVPWQELPALGSPNEMRAYFRDRFRDEWRILGQFELRLHEIKGRFGLATWVAAGTVAPSLGQAAIKETLFEVGIGLRYRLQPRQHARIDLAIGRGAIGFALNVLEAF